MSRQRRLDTRTQSWRGGGTSRSISRKRGVDARRRWTAPDVCSARLVSGRARKALPAGLEKTFELYRSAPSRVVPTALFPHRGSGAAILPRVVPRLVKAQKILYAALSYPHPTAAPSGLAAG
uniref:Ornithine carbamoyltransferase n=1 Tax=Burkholderia orbicola (strain AU 1054) TaxID=331271 RepID=A0A0H2XQW1_BURO1